MLKINFIFLLILSYCIIQSYCITIPKMVYPKLRNICKDQQKFKKCMIENKAVSKEEADSLEKMMIAKKCCPFPEDDDKMKARLEELAADKEMNDRLSGMKSKLGAFLKCTT